MVLVYEKHIEQIRETLEKIAALANRSIEVTELKGEVTTIIGDGNVTLLPVPRMEVLSLGVMAAQLIEQVDAAKCGYSAWYKRTTPPSVPKVNGPQLVTHESEREGV